MIRWQNWRMLIFFMHQILNIHPQRGGGDLCFSCMCNGFCASTVDVNGNMLICCACHSLTCPIYIHTLYFVLNSLEQLVLNILKTTTEWKARIAYVLGRKHYPFYTLSWLLTCPRARHGIISILSLLGLISVSNQSKGWLKDQNGHN